MVEVINAVAEIAPRQELHMDMTTILVIVVLVLLLGGGWYGHGRWYGR